MVLSVQERKKGGVKKMEFKNMHKRGMAAHSGQWFSKYTLWSLIKRCQSGQDVQNEYSFLDTTDIPSQHTATGEYPVLQKQSN